MWTSILIAAIVMVIVICGLGFGWIVDRERLRLKRLRFKNREFVDVDELIKKHFPDVPDIQDSMVHWWNRAASILEIDPRLLRPDDRFDDKLAPVAGFLMSDEILELEELIDDLGLSTETKLNTLGEYVLFLARQRRAEEKEIEGGQN